MVFLILTRKGFDDILERVDTRRDAVWVHAGVLSQQEIADLRSAGWDLTDFIKPSSDLISDTETIREHHPAQVIWVECPDPSNQA